MMRRLMALVIVWVICLPGLAAGPMCPEFQSAADRSAFIKAERSPPKNRTAWERLRSDLGGYPLFPYVELARLRTDLPHVAAPEIEAFLKRYDGEPVTFGLQRQWLHQLAGRRKWRKFIEWYPGGDSIDLKCHYARALLELGDEPGALSVAERLWMSGKSRPKECDPVFAVWLESDRFSPSLAWERIGLAMARGNVRLARYLERFVDLGGRRVAAAWRAVHKTPRRVGTIKIDGEPARVGGGPCAWSRTTVAPRSGRCGGGARGAGGTGRARRRGTRQDRASYRIVVRSPTRAAGDRLAMARRCSACRQTHVAVACRGRGASLPMAQGHRRHRFDAGRGTQPGAMALLARTRAGGDRKIGRSPRGLRIARA